MVDETVYVEFEPPRKVAERKKSYWLSAVGTEGEADIQLPVRKASLNCEDTPDGEIVVGAWIPRYIAEDRGLVPSQENDDERDEMTPRDWYTLGMAMALVMCGRSTNLSDEMWEAKKLAAKLLNERTNDG